MIGAVLVLLVMAVVIGFNVAVMMRSDREAESRRDRSRRANRDVGLYGGGYDVGGDFGGGDFGGGGGDGGGGGE